MSRLALLRRVVLLAALGLPAWAQERLLVFAGAASRPPTEELARLFEQRTGTKVDVVFGGSGFVLSQMRLARKGDVYFPGSSDFMELAKQQGAVLPQTERPVAYLAPAICVQKGNPKGIRGLGDLLRPGVRIAIAQPEQVCVGTYAVEILEEALDPAGRAAFRANLATYTESCEKTATAVSLKAVDAVLGWSVFGHWDPARIEVVPLRPGEVRRVGYLPLAVSTFSANRALAQRFVDLVASPEGRAVFARHHYFATPGEAFAWIGQPKPVGGRYELPAAWRGR